MNSIEPVIETSTSAQPNAIPSRWVRAVFILLGIGGWFLTQSLISARTPPPGAIDDGMHRILAPIHDYLRDHNSVANVLMIVSSAFIDGFAIFILLRSIFGRSIRPFVAIFILFGLRQLCQVLCSLPAPQEMIWHYPGVPAILVTYGVATDLFFSGHTSVAVLGSIELSRIGKRWLAFGALVAIFEMITVLSLRAHYTMDVFAAAMTAFVASGIADRISPPLDRALAKISKG